MPFNPTLVWFQPAMKVPCRLREPQLSIPPWSDFNVNNVRNTANAITGDFQSHLGLISTFIPHFFAELELLLSIPPWSDFNAFFEYINQKSREELSIPPWSDFNTRSLQSSSIGAQSFNPTLVWFQQCFDVKRTVPPCRTFNPTLVWFQRAELVLSMPKEMVPFNPTLVWFQQFSFTASFRLRITFNPTLVWFQLISSFYQPVSYSPLSIPPWSDFNSKAVRVSHLLHTLSIPPWSDFNIYFRSVSPTFL